MNTKHELPLGLLDELNTKSKLVAELFFATMKDYGIPIGSKASHDAAHHYGIFVAEALYRGSDEN